MHRLVLLPLVVLSACQSSTSPYAGQESRVIKALAADQVASLLAGEGMGFAKVAELNGYPGPKHVLELADRLELTDGQRAAVAGSFERMRAEAVRLGEEIVSSEQELDRLFSAAAAEPSEVAGRLEAIGALNGRLRNAHVAAHLEMKSVLTPAQVDRYNELRGYAEHHH